MFGLKCSNFQIPSDLFQIKHHHIWSNKFPI